MSKSNSAKRRRENREDEQTVEFVRYPWGVVPEQRNSPKKDYEKERQEMLNKMFKGGK